MNTMDSHSYFHRIDAIKNNLKSVPLVKSIEAVNALIREFDVFPEAYALRAELYERVAEQFISGEVDAYSNELAALIASQYKESSGQDISSEDLTPEFVLELALEEYAKVISIAPDDFKYAIASKSLLKKLGDTDPAPHTQAQASVQLSNDIKELKQFREWYHRDLQAFIKPWYDTQPDISAADQQLLNKLCLTNPQKLNDTTINEACRQTHMAINTLASNPTLAQHRFEAALHIFKYDIIAFSYLGHIHHQTGSIEDAFSVFSSIIEAFDYPLAYLSRAEIFYEHGERKAARNDMQQFLQKVSPVVIDKFNGSIDSIINCINESNIDFSQSEFKTDASKLKAAEKELEFQKYKQTIISTQDLLAENPLDPALYQLRYKAFSKLRYRPAALEAITLKLFLDTTASKKERCNDYLKRALLLIELDQPLLAFSNIAHTQQNSLLLPYAIAVANRAEHLMKPPLKNYKLALEHLDTALCITLCWRIYSLKGDCHLALHQPNEAVEAYKNSLAIEETETIKAKITNAELTVVQKRVMASLHESHQVLHHQELWLSAIESGKAFQNFIENTMSEAKPSAKKKSNDFPNNAVSKRKSGRHSIATRIESEPLQTNHFFAEQKQLREQQQKEKLAKEQERKQRDKIQAKSKRQAKLIDKKSQIPTDESSDDSDIDWDIDVLVPTTVSKPDNIKIILTDIEKTYFARFYDYIAQPENKAYANKNLLLSGGSVFDRIRHVLYPDQHPAPDASVTNPDYITDLPRAVLKEIYPEGECNRNLEDAFGILIGSHATRQKIDIFHLPDLKPKTILDHKDYFPFTVDNLGDVNDLADAGFHTLASNVLRPIQLVSKMFDDPLIIYRTLYQQSKRQLIIPNKVMKQIKKDKHKLADLTLLSAERTNDWLTRLFSQGLAEKNYALLIKHEIFHEIFPDHIREIVNNDAWLQLQMTRIPKDRYPIIQRIFSSFVIAIVMQNIHDEIGLAAWKTPDTDVVALEHAYFQFRHIYPIAIQVIQSSPYFSTAFATPASEKTKSFLEPAIRGWLQFYKPDIILVEQPSLASRARFFLNPPRQLESALDETLQFDNEALRR